MAYEFEQKLKALIASVGEYAAVEKINENTDFVLEFGYNSVNLIQLIVKLEDEFDFEFDDDELILENISKYSELVEIVRKKLN